MNKIAIIDKAPSRNNYKNYFNFDFELFHMSSVPITKLLKKDVDLVIDLNDYNLVVLVGSEAAKEYAKVTSVTNYAGQLMHDKYICISNPAMLHFKPEGKPDFQRSVDRIHKYIDGTITNASLTGKYLGISDTDKAIDFLKEVLDNAEGYVAMDTETTCLYPRDGYVLGLSVSYKAKQGAYISTDCLDSVCIDLLLEIIAKYNIVFHNMKFDIKMIEYHIGIKFDRSRVHDTMLMHYVLDENDSHGLKPLALKYTDYGDYDAELDTFKKAYCATNGVGVEDFTYDLIPFDIIAKYAAIDTAVTLTLFHKFWPNVQKNDKLLSVYQNLLIPGTLFLMDMEEVGIPIDRERMVAAENYLDKWILEAKQEVYAYPEVQNFEKDSGIIFNPNSVQQLRKVLFDYAKLTPTGKKTGTGAISTDAEVLEELSEEHPLPKAILKVRQLGKIKNTYISKILPELDKDERIRTNFNLIFTTSGRLSSSGKFNAQQIPRDNPIIKGCIVAPVGFKIVSQDLTTAEMYYAAVLSGDKNLQQVFVSGGDFHSTIAKMVFDLPCQVEDVKKTYSDMRQSAKAISFGILYGSGPQKVSDTVSKETGEYYGIDRAKEDISSYFTKFSRLKGWLKSRKEFIEANGYTYSFFGRKRRLINVFSTDKGIAAHEVRSGINAEVQSIASDINLLAAIETAKELKDKNINAEIFMLVHDSIVALVKDEHIEEYCEILRKNTQKDRGCSIPKFPIGIDQDVGQDYSFGKFDKQYKLDGDCLSII
ncbi:PolA DNA polymerase I - 3'-5' exonuclease and polymerase domains [uncultured Caudovirales phage]|uniref:DNA polymerase n=1 Tax=uncultured Caudovirales phage TaxID=2100421 RepID=A0A6J5RI92_9CAUD|nr:PolA DNA polymerase I - 3'-5' exonuclease and polymerase domains [uncultured Caudovirales phage]CAB4185609.1 PolA DNA polymerase I - 3'-5' exonuclease and polymerase domains [uncultured Caudovirales phage]CAB4193221.1 PolA DNA polymerase I - 3'-5' exonuclease and polymerase domains [uncultured Caudovirales phage]CAB4216180.1 PolA DNA polymerase I - 3'-5' exonuclease and polymerase domains [uncultured Caudovirales phage]CAB5230806.1 PolA DNA polymerase I - 3'-5' exonuclease and polymerase dom